MQSLVVRETFYSPFYSLFIANSVFLLQTLADNFISENIERDGG